MWRRKKKKTAGGCSEYNGFPVYEAARARLVPWGDEKPDCMCELLLTELYLYALEDNFNNTYTEQYVVPLNKITFLGITASVNRDRDTVSAAFNTAAAAVMGAVTGLYVYDDKSMTGKRKAKYYLRIDYQDDQGKRDIIFFEDLDPKVDKLIEYWNKMQ